MQVPAKRLHSLVAELRPSKQARAQKQLDYFPILPESMVPTYYKAHPAGQHIHEDVYITSYVTRHYVTSDIPPETYVSMAIQGSCAMRGLDFRES